MGRQDGLVKLKGSVGEITFYKNEDGYLARKKTGVTAQRVREDPKFARTRENMAGYALQKSIKQLLR